MVQSLVSTFGGGDGYVQVFFDPALSDEVVKTAWSQAGIKRRIIRAGFPRYYTSYFTPPPCLMMVNPIITPETNSIITYLVLRQDGLVPGRRRGT
ncbi:hypothetical protein ACFLYX_01885 [Chloroflexota bacterium]